MKFHKIKTWNKIINLCLVKNTKSSLKRQNFKGYCFESVFLWHSTTEGHSTKKEFTRKSVLHVFVLYNLLGPGTLFYRKSKINIKRKPNHEIGWFHDWPTIISHRLYAFHFTNDDFPL